jgi:outer membrane protein TolC
MGSQQQKELKKLNNTSKKDKNNNLMNQKPIKVFAWICCLLFACSTAMAQTGVKHAFTVKECVDYAHKNNVQVKNALLNVQIQQEINRDVTAAALPSLSGVISGNDYLKIPTSLLPGEIFGQPAGTYIPVQFGTKYNANAGLQLQQLLFDGQVFVGLQARSTSIAFSNKNVEVTEEMIKANVYKIYYQLVASKTQIGIFDANLDRLNKLLSDTKALYQNGFVEKLDIDKISVQISNLETDKLKALNSIDIGYQALKTLIGMPTKDVLILTEELTEDKIKKDFTSDTTFNYADRKDFQYLDLAKQLNELNIKRYKMSFLPTLSLSGSYTKNAQRNQFNFFGKGDWFTTSFVGVNLSVPIFSGFSKTSHVTKSKLELQQTVNQIDNLRLTIDNEIETAKLNFNAATITLDYQKKNMALAENVFNQTKKKFELGTGSNTEITAAQTDLRTAQANYINALYAAIIAKVDYYKAIGKL